MQPNDFPLVDEEIEQAPYVVFALKPDAMGILKHVKSGVVYNPSWHGGTPQDVTARMVDDMRWLLGTKEWELVEQEKPALHVVQHKLDETTSNEPKEKGGVMNARVSHIEKVGSSTGTEGFKFYRLDSNNKKVSIATTYSPKLISQLEKVLDWVDEMEIGDTRAVKTSVLVEYKKSDKKSEHGNAYNDIIAVREE